MEILVLNGIVNGLVVGGVYALIGMSLTLLYGVLRVVNFAHGEMVIGGSFLAYVLFHAAGIPPLLALPVAAVSFFALGYVAYYLLIPRLARSDDPESMSFLMMYGVSIALAALMLLLFEADSRSIDYTFNPISMKIGPVYVSTARVVALAITIVVSAAVGLFLFATLPGKALRAAIMNREAIQIMGVDIVRLSAFAFALATGLAGITGVLVALVFPAFNAFSGPEYSIIGFIVIVLGGLGNPIGALLAGVAYGLVEQLATVFLPQALAQIVGFGLLVAVILFRNAGFMRWRVGR
ncbi:branched-chain amino acid ABC transporter permease [Vineibacter terrae]|uniref:Branched-chain amino acid ABC transporter permease n=1 Tax=Vineibacter terrae TaxID=2586908 RepID=A0A5C8PT79_9HYPH|nr:branched-chain amino acid ABC transporter permease [Vineibacter terrae]TXL81562.1 branched-chain amino acid ABC transporter permease [Vineibacter terrae]HEX2889845.1 branched-chain amino acid ABC transporter permease [Vineibacter terrae]